MILLYDDLVLQHLVQVLVAVDYTAEFNKEDDNLAGALRKTYPRYFGWLPENLATLDGESPEVKRAKNVLEGAYLGLGTDMLLGLNKLFRGRVVLPRVRQSLKLKRQVNTSVVMLNLKVM